MNPRTKLQVNIMGLSKSFRPLSEKQKQWAYANCLFNYYAIASKNVFCLECGHKWVDESITKNCPDKCVCPECKKRLFYAKNYSPKMKESEYVAMLTTKENFQVIRFFFITKYYKKLQQPSFSESEVMQHWISDTGQVTFLQKSTHSQTMYYDCWKFDSNLACKGNIGRDHLRNNSMPYRFFPSAKLLPELIRNGFSGNFHEITPYKLLSSLLSDSIVETLFKSAQFNIVDYLLKSDSNKMTILKYWPSIKLCIRNKYIVQDAKMWIDYIDLISDFGKDLYNAHYVCPKDLKQMHDKYVIKKRMIEQKIEEKVKREKAEQENAMYIETKKPFLGVAFGDETIQVKVLESVQEFMQEGDIMHHCVFTNKYYSKPDALVLSARINGVPVETIEVSISNLSIEQCHGRCNKNTEYHDQILQLVTQNMYKIEQCLRAVS